MAEDDSVLTRPSAAPAATVAYGEEPEQIADVRFGKADGREKTSEGAKRRPLVVIVHGGFWRPAYDRAHTGPMATALADAGWTVASIEYRRVPGQPGLTLSDVALAIERLPGKISGHSGRVILVGHSAGGHLVLWAAANSSSSSAVAGVVALAPVSDLRLADARGLGSGAVRAFLGGDPVLHSEIDPTRRSSATVPVAVVHGTADDTVPIEIARSYVAAHPATRLVALEGVGHYAVIDPRSAAWPPVVAELQRLSH